MPIEAWWFPPAGMRKHGTCQWAVEAGAIGSPMELHIRADWIVILATISHGGPPRAWLLGTPLAVASLRVREGRAMSSLRDVRGSYGDHAISDEDPSLGNALERVFEAQQNLVVRRVDLLVEQLNALGGNFVSTAVSALLGSL